VSLSFIQQIFVEWLLYARHIISLGEIVVKKKDKNPCFKRAYCWKYGPQNDHVKRSDLAKRFFIAGGRGREQRELRERERQVLKYPSVRLSMI
jgi:hypothetical protein